MQETYIEEILNELTLEEKIGMIHGAGLFRTEGVERLSIPPLYMSDGPMGVRAEFADNEWRNIGTTEDYVTYLPCNSAIASTWNRDLAGKAGEVLGEEARGRGKDVILAPGINIKRSPLCGRNFEYMSEDPRLIEELVVPMIEGIQKNDVAACVKHFATNSQETERLWVDTIVDEETLEEIYFPGFKAAVQKGHTISLMGAYNLLNGEHCCMSKSLLNEKLRKEWAFDGVVISDWGAVHDTKQAAESGLDIEMDVKYQFNEQYMADPLFKAVQDGEIEESLVDEKVRNILRMMLRLKMIGPEKENRKTGAYNTEEHRRSVLDVARESIILLKNEDQVLPLWAESGCKVAVIGANAAAIHSNGGGSAEIKALYEISPLMGIKKMLGGNVKVSYAPGYVIPDKEEASEINWQAASTGTAGDMEKESTVSGSAPDENTVGGSTPEKQQKAAAESYRKKQQEALAAAVALAKASDIVIFVGGLNHDFDVEGLDRADMKLPYGQDEVIETLLKVAPDMVVCMYAGAPVEMPWAEKAKAILWSYYAGMEGGTALAEILFGKVNPSGKLAETFIRDASQCPAHTIGTFGKKDRVEYREGVMVGYRYYDTEKTEILFPFGHGLSYTGFSYGDLEIVQHKERGKQVVKVSCTVKNDGVVDGKETVQIYVAQEQRKNRPFHELKAFEKVELHAGETKKICIVLEEKDFAYYDVQKKTFLPVSGTYEIQVGTSSTDIRLCGKINQIFE